MALICGIIVANRTWTSVFSSTIPEVIKNQVKGVVQLSCPDIPSIMNIQAASTEAPASDRSHSLQVKGHFLERKRLWTHGNEKGHQFSHLALPHGETK